VHDDNTVKIIIVIIIATYYYYYYYREPVQLGVCNSCVSTTGCIMREVELRRGRLTITYNRLLTPQDNDTMIQRQITIIIIVIIIN